MRKLYLTFVIVLFGFQCPRANALTSKEIQTFINDAIKAGGGEVIIPPGEHLITQTLVINDAKKLRIIGYDKEKSVLKLPPLVFAETKAATKAGESRIAIQRLQGLVAGMHIRIEAEGAIDPFTHKPTNYQAAVVNRVEGDSLVLHEPLKFPVPAATLIRDSRAPNLIELRGNSENVGIEKLTLDGGRLDGDPLVHGHAELCGIFSQGKYTYEKGLLGSPVKGVRVSRCIIQHCFGRGIALYATEGARIEDCTIMDTADEAIDLDHLTSKVVVRHNNIARCGVAIELNDANDCLVEANECLDCGIGINLWRFCKLPDLNHGHRITGNVFNGMRGNGVQISKDTSNNSVTDNEINHSGRNGISVAGANQTIKGNRITASGMKDISETEKGAIIP